MKKIKTAPGHGDNGGNEVDPNGLLKDIVGKAKTLWGKIHPQAMFNEEMVHGNHGSWRALVQDGSHSEADLDTSKYGKRNYLRNAALDRSARVLEGIPSARTRPNSGWGPDIGASIVANKVIRHIENANDYTELLSDVELNGQNHHSSGIQVAWDSDIGPRLKGKSSPRGGGVSLRPATVFGSCTDGAEYDRFSEWVVFKDVVPLNEARAMLEGAGMEEEANKLAEGSDQLGENGTDTDTGIVTWGVWIKPNAQFPKGLHMEAVDEVVYSHEDFPYQHGEHPLARFEVMHRRGSCWGESHVTDAVPIQLAHNESVKVQMERRRWLRDLIIEGPTNAINELKQQKGNSVKLIARNHEQGGIEFKILEDDLRAWKDEEESTRQQLVEIFGTQFAFGGGDLAGSASARAISFRNRLDEIKFSKERESLRSMVKKVMRQGLALYQQYASFDLLLRIAGEQNAAYVQMFIDADLDGLDLVFETVAGIEDTPSAIADRAAAGVAEGTVDPASGAEQSETGLDHTAEEAQVLGAVTEQAFALLEGFEVEVDPTLAAPMAVAKILELARAYASHPNVVALHELAQAYEETMQQQQPQPPEPGQPPAGFVPPPTGPGDIPLT